MTQLRHFFYLEPRSKSHQDLTTSFFQLKALTEEAKMKLVSDSVFQGFEFFRHVF